MSVHRNLQGVILQALERRPGLTRAHFRARFEKGGAATISRMLRLGYIEDREGKLYVNASSTSAA